MNKLIVVFNQDVPNSPFKKGDEVAFSIPVAKALVNIEKVADFKTKKTK